jgi:hypothetical protein
MTIRILRAWNGYADGDVVTLSAQEETRLVGLGLATAGVTAEKSASFGYSDVSSSLGDERFLIASVGNGAPTSFEDSLKNTAIVQSMLDALGADGSKSKKLIFNTPGIYSFRGGSNPQGILEVPDNVEIEIGAGVILDNLGSDVFPFLSKTLFVNKNCTSNFTTITGTPVAVADANNWTSRVTFNIGSAPNPFAVDEYVYVRPAYTSGDTTGYFNWVYEVMEVNNSNPASKTFSIDIAGIPSTIPTLTGNLIAYPANANITIHGKGAIRQATQNRGGGSATVFSRSSFMQTVLNKVINCESRVNLIQSPGSVSAVIANSFNCTIGADGTVCNGVMVFGNTYGFTVEGVAGESKDDLVVIFPDGSGYPFFDAGGTQANSKGPVIGGVIDYKGKVHKNCMSHGLVLMSEENSLIDGITVKNYVGRNMNGQFLGIHNGYLTFGGQCNIGAIAFENINYQPRQDKPFAAFTSILNGTTNIKKLTFDNLNIIGGSVDGNVGFRNSNGRLLSVGNGFTGLTIDELSFDKSTIQADATTGANLDLIYMSGTTLVKRFTITKSKVITVGNAFSVGFFNADAASAPFGIEEFIAKDVECGLPFRGLLRCNTAGKAPKIHLEDVKVVHADQNGITNGELPNGTKLVAIDCDYSIVAATRGLMFLSGSNTFTYDLTFGGNFGGSRQLINANSGPSTNKTFNIRSMGANQAAVQTLGGAGNTWTFSGNCSDIRADLAGVTRTAGSSLTASVNAGTILANNVAICDATGATNSWKQLSNSALVF